MTLPAPIQRAAMLMRQTFDLWWGGGTTASSSAVIAWDASKSGDRLKNWWPPSLDFTSYANPQQLKDRARDADRNNPWAHRITNLMRDYVCGTGLKPLIDLPDAALRQRVGKLWSSWCDQADYNGFRSFYGLQAAAFRATLIDGESLALLHPGETLKVQLLGSEFFSRQNDNAIDIGGGIQYDMSGRRTGYWLYNKLPAQALNPIPTLVPADRVVHMFAPQQPGFERGVSWLAPALVALYELQGFLESSLIRARTGSLFAGFLRSADGTNILSPTGNPIDANAPVNFEPGSIARLRPGDELQFTTPPDPSMSYGPFVQTQLRAIASSLGIPYELASGDLQNVTFASGRHALIAFERTVDALAQNVVGFCFCRPIWDWWRRIEVAKGTLPKKVLTAQTRWIGPEFQMLDSRASTNTTTAKIRGGLMSRSEAVSSTGADPEALDEQIAADNARADRLGLIFDSDPRRVTLQGLEQPSEAKDGSTTIQ
jgi:lambda family phage portal protein